ncbi:hypothetical protein [Ktedonospora formicarum]|uniref:hypothetical protein n=1 Tax=Ktedonospora formicarum TaxID=2778364 RepID=UPI001C68C234|nr:hypothetical protein [Ktedonospora formicarum]
MRQTVLIRYDAAHQALLSKIEGIGHLLVRWCAIPEHHGDSDHPEIAIRPAARGCGSAWYPVKPDLAIRRDPGYSSWHSPRYRLGPVNSFSFPFGTAYGVIFLISLVAAGVVECRGHFVTGKAAAHMNDFSLEEMMKPESSVARAFNWQVKRVMLFTIIELLGLFIIFTCMPLMCFGLQALVANRLSDEIPEEKQIL